MVLREESVRNAVLEMFDGGQLVEEQSSSVGCTSWGDGDGAAGGGDNLLCWMHWHKWFNWEVATSDGNTIELDEMTLESSFVLLLVIRQRPLGR